MMDDQFPVGLQTVKGLNIGIQTLISLRSEAMSPPGIFKLAKRAQRCVWSVAADLLIPDHRCQEPSLLM